MNIGLTGGMGSGKNFVADLFAKKGCYTLDADEVSRRVTATGTNSYREILAAFGSGILAADTSIDRALLRKVVTRDAQRLNLLESILHPAINTYTRRWIGEIKGRDDKAIIIYHAPLLLEAGNAGDLFDAIAVIWCTKETQLERLKARGYPPYAEALKLMERQMPFEAKVQHAQFIIDNDGSPEETEKDVERVYNLIKILQYTNRLNKKAGIPILPQK